MGTGVNRLQGKTAIVTGGSRGLGAAIALRFAAEGCDVAIVYRERADKAAEVVGAIETAGAKAIAVQADCTDEAQVGAMVDEVLAAFGVVRILVNNAGILNLSPIAGMPVEVWDEMMTSHLRSHFLVTRACLQKCMLDLEPLPGERVAAKIINMGSGLVNRGGLSAATRVHYMTAKAGVAGFTRGLAAELAPKITVNAIAPGIHLTDMVGAPPPEVEAQLAGYFLLGLPTDADVAAAAAYLASPDGDHLSAEILTTNGGST
jgi:3-oxoacyl-[acyl-carrier protein] reductase